MKNILIKSFVIAFVAGVLPLASFAAAKKSAEDAAEPAKSAEKKPDESVAKKLPYRGLVSAMDPAAKTFTLKGKEKERVFQITDSTKITKDGEAADMSAIAAGEAVRGQATKNGDKWEAASVMLGAKPETEKKGVKAKAEKSAEPMPDKKK